MPDSLTVGKSKAGSVLPAERQQCSTLARRCPESLLAIFMSRFNRSSLASRQCLTAHGETQRALYINMRRNRLEMLEHRHYPRFTMEIDVEVYGHAIGRLAGRTADISESGIAILMVATLKLAATVGLKFDSPVGQVHSWAVVRNRNAFRYGLEFIRSQPSQEQIDKICYKLAEVGRTQDRVV
jgi:hypothetical protein